MIPNVIGRVLGKRYRIIDRLGGGGMAAVYRAEDLFLGRRVAVKVLHEQFSSDEEFLRRFRREGHAAASLSHANVVSIYDVGQEGGSHYIVLELVEGRTLKEIIQERGPLPVAQATALAIEILDALCHAHSQRIIHRDIKPHNILIAQDGRLKVTDFGLARGSTTDTVANSGSMMGSAHYLAPEVARGAPATAQADLYALGCVLYEMVTGQVPFQGDSSITVALKHVHEEPVPPVELNSEVPVELAVIIGRAMAKRPEDRFATATEMRADLAQFRENLNSGRVSRAVAADFPTQDLRELKKVKGAPARNARRDQPPRRGRSWGLWLVLLLLAVLIPAGGLAGWRVWQFLNPPPVVRVPALIGLPVTQAQGELEQLGLQPKIVGEGEFSDLPPTYVVRIQNADPGTEVRAGRVIELVLSKGRKTITVPRVVTLSRIEAQDAVARAGLKVGAIFETYDRQVPEGRVIRQMPLEGTVAQENQAVDVWISRGALLVPRVEGKSLADARKELQSLSLVPVEADRVPHAQPKDTVVAQNPPAGAEATPETKVNLTLSTGSPLVINEAVKKIRVPGMTGRYVQIQVLLSDGAGANQLVLDERRLAGETIDQKVRWVGAFGKLTILVNGVFSYELPLP